MEALIFIPILLGIYFLPWIVALNRQREPVGIFLLNLFLGWTLVGWVAALVWASTGKSPQAAPSNFAANPQPPLQQTPQPAPITPAPAPRTSPASLEAQGQRVSGRMFKKAANLGLAVGSGEDEGEGDTSNGARTEPAVAHLSYIDANENPSQRLITLRAITSKSPKDDFDSGHLIAYCHMRQSPRTFRIDRIESLVDVTTGEVFDTPELIESWLTSRTPPNMAAALDGLTVLCFVAACDDMITDAEVAAMARFVVQVVPGATVPPDFASRLARFAPTPEAVLTALIKAVKNGHTAQLEAALEHIVDADDKLHPAEIEALTFLKMTMTTS